VEYSISFPDEHQKKEELVKYSIFTVMNSGYVYGNFGRIFVNSIHRNLDISKIDTIYIGDIGLSKKDKEFLNSFEKVKIVDSGVVTKNVVIHDDDWVESVNQKTILLKELCKTSDCPIVLIDLDCYFVNDFYQHIDLDYDIQVVERDPWVHPNHIASWVVINNMEKGVRFIDEWMNIMKNYTATRHKESPSLDILVKDNFNRNEYKVKVLKERKIIGFGELRQIEEWESHIAHFKGWARGSSPEEDFYLRVFGKGRHPIHEIIEEWINV